MRHQFIALCAASLFVAGCDEWDIGGFDRFREDFQYTYNVSPGVRVYLENMNGPVEITGWEKNEMQVMGTKHASSESTLKALKIDVVNSGDIVRIRTIAPSGHRGAYGAKYIIRLPQRATLEQIESSNGHIRIESIDGPARLRTSNGGLRILRVTGPVEGVTSNSGVEVSDVRNGVNVRSSNGSIKADNVRGAFEATTSNSGMTIVLNEPAPQNPIRLTTSNGSVDLTLTQFRDNDVRIATSNASITLRLPSSAKGTVKAHTSNSSINSEFDLMVRAGELKKSWVEGTIGGGGPMLDLSTSNASIRLARL